MRVATLTISTSKAADPGQHEGTAALADYVASMDARLVGAEVIPDDRDLISSRLTHWADGGAVDLILTSGGTGLAPGDALVFGRESVGLPPELVERFGGVAIPTAGDVRSLNLSNAVAIALYEGLRRSGALDDTFVETI